MSWNLNANGVANTKYSYTDVVTRFTRGLRRAMIIRCTNCDTLYLQGDADVDCVIIMAKYTDGRVTQDVGLTDPFFFCRQCKAVVP